MGGRWIDDMIGRDKKERGLAARSRLWWDRGNGAGGTEFGSTYR